MEGNAHPEYLQQEDVSYDDLMNNGGWSMAPGDQFTFPPAPPPQPTYQQYSTNQPAFDHYQQQPSYAVPYSTSPYTSHYQQGPPSDVFVPTSYSVEPSLQNPTLYHGHESSFSFAPQEAATISPHTLEYHVPPSQPMHGGVSNPAFQRTANNYTPMAQEQPSAFFNNTQNAPVQQVASVQYPALQSSNQEYAPKPSVKTSRDVDALPNAPLAQQIKTQPKPIQQPRITNSELLARNKSSSGPKLRYAPYIAWSGPPVPVSSSIKVPKYPQLKSGLEEYSVPGFDISRILTPVQASFKNIRPPKEKKKPIVSTYKGTSQAAKQATDKVTNLRDADGNLSATIKRPSSPTESSSSEEESSTDEESEYGDDEMPVVDISTVRDPTRPTGVAAAAGWDATGIVWKDPNSSPSADIIKSAIEDYGTFVGALRLQLKVNSTKMEEAGNDPAELHKLQQARIVHLDALYEAINSASTLGYGAIVENLGGHEKLVHGLTTTLIECIKADDFVGRLPKAIFNLLARFKTMSEALLKRLRFDSIQKRWNKKGDEEIKKNISLILSQTIEAKERAYKVSKDAARAEEEKKGLEKLEQAKARKPETGKVASVPTSAKRPHEGDPASTKPNKKFAPDVAGPAATTSKSALPKRPTNLLANNLLGITSKSASKPAPKKRESSPPTESKLGALLASIAKPPEPPKAPEAPPRAPETPEEKQRRERKESRRHLRVKFKEGPELEQIRLFQHEQAEDEGRQDDMLRDAHDDRSEGMMHKKRVSESMDAGLEDEDSLSGDFEERPYPSLVPIDFNELVKSTIFGPAYTTRGGDRTFTTPEQQTQERREALELMIVYTDPKDIPPSAKEPPHDTKVAQQERQLKGPTEPWIVQRLQEIQQYGSDYATQIFFGRRAEEQRLKGMQGSHARGIPPSSSTSSTNISSILQQLGGPAGSQPSQDQSKVTMDPLDLQNLIRIVESLKGKPYPPVEPPTWMTNEAQRADWWAGYNRDQAAKASQFQPQPVHSIQNHQQMPAPQMQSYAPQPNILSTPHGTNDVAQQVQAYLAGLATKENRSGSSHQQYDFNGLSLGHGLNHDYAKENQHPRWDGERENGMGRSKPNQDNYNPNGKQRGHDGKQWTGGYDPDSLFDENGEYKGKKKPCKFWGQGKCAKGAKCTFLHEES